MRIHGDVRAARLEDPQQAHHQLEGPLHIDTDQHVGAHPQTAEIVRQLVGPLVQLAIGQPGVTEENGSRVRVIRGLIGNEFVDTDLTRVRLVGRVPLDQHLTTFLVVKQRQLGGPPGWIGDNRSQQTSEVPYHPLDRRSIEQIRVVLQGASQPAWCLVHRQRQIELCRAGLRVQGRKAQTGCFDFRDRSILEGEHHLEQRSPTGITLGLKMIHQLLER